jgi:hypothetical protein
MWVFVVVASGWSRSTKEAALLAAGSNVVLEFGSKASGVAETEVSTADK